ncbi:hypothetical protein [Gilvimarinus xylanilyticus]|uniref:Uncharacterized protein n=1 Tax=Gilvimarinus xylanilyticus TaxID=2944139 RepID=A0A9X2HZS8_9GAMM|nr:hypothetical protein [Gilvimarinus xylanilyticus]MCP8900784.1 hypothetical protein [Gilvimarinus xylanilyticus]
MTASATTQATTPRRFSGWWCLPVLLLLFTLGGQSQGAGASVVADALALDLLQVDIGHTPETLDEPDHELAFGGEPVPQDNYLSLSVGLYGGDFSASPSLAFSARAPPAKHIFSV